MNFNQIHSFYLVAQLGTYQAAAERLHATQPAISARIASLETTLNTRLFDRSGYRVSLTPEGRRFLPYAEKLLELQTNAMLEVRNSKDLSGVVRIGASDTMVASWLPDFLLELKERQPGISVEMFVGASPLLHDDLMNQAVDLAFLLGPISAPRVLCKDFCTADMGFVAAPSLGLHGRELTTHELRDQNFLTFEKCTVPYQHLRQNLKEVGILAKTSPISALHSISILTRKGLGIGYVPLVAVEKDLATGRLQLLEIPLKTQTLHFSVCYLDGPHRRLVEAIADGAMEFMKRRGPSSFINFTYQGA
ncbi:LysR family transcriptional regulator [Roseibacterium beibuensis]|uniref:LysR family transcriptional regulator MumR n=1 Tax=[Roseibacterium] beibuensis TaxID=1193142 RepID=A0ABP9KRN6_9RHOB|nr:LysR family transcriptional regulator [Roseibacterium beibuensis]MCS6622459.1 LysR family transcriptional regulator [Roseibacterium beibuensis]